MILILLLSLLASVALGQSNQNGPVFKEKETVRIKTCFYDFDNRPAVPAFFTFRLDDADTNEVMVPTVVVTDNLETCYQYFVLATLNVVDQGKQYKRVRYRARAAGADGFQTTTEDFYIIQKTGGIGGMP